MDFDNEVLDALAHLDSAPAGPTNIKTDVCIRGTAIAVPRMQTMILILWISTMKFLMLLLILTALLLLLLTSRHSSL